MRRKKLVIGAAAVALAFPAAAGVLTVGVAGAQRSQAHAQRAQTAPPTKADGSADGETDAPVSLPAGSVSQDQAQQAAVAYVQQTASYSTQGLTVQGVTVDDENGTAVYKVTFTSPSGAGAEVTVSAQGKALKAEADGTNEHKHQGQDGETNDGPDQSGKPGAGAKGKAATPATPGTVGR